MSETAEVTINETPVSITIIGDTPIITIHDNTPQVSIYDNSTSITTTINAIPEVTIEADTDITITADEQPVVVVNLGAGNPYDASTLLAMLAGKLSFTEFDPTLQADILNNRDMWGRIGNEIVLLYQDGVDITTANQTYTDTEITFSVAAIHVTITGEVDVKLTVIRQTATDISQTVTDLQISTEGSLVAQQSQITQNAASIISTVTRLTSLDGPTGEVTINTSEISQNADAITLEITNRETLGTTVNTHHAEIVLNTTDIGLQVSQIAALVGRVDTAEINITATSVITSVLSTTVGAHEYSIEAVETLLANRWAVNILEDAGGNEYSTGFQLMLHPVWLVDAVYVVDDTIFYDEKIYICILGHTATTVNKPDGTSGSTYWTEVVGGVHSEFVVQADKFQVSVPTETSPVPVFTVTGGTVRINGTLITDTLEALTAYIEMSIQSTNYVVGVSGWRLDKSGNFNIYGGAATFGTGVVPWSGIGDDDGHKPEDDADVTGSNTAANIVNQGDLAVLDNIGITDLDTTVIVGGKITTNLVNANSIDVTNLAAIVANLGTITAGNITLDTSGYIRGGQTAYATGTGFFLGYSGAAYKFSIGDTTKYLKWDGGTLSIGGDIVATGNIQTDAITTPKIIADAITNIVSSASDSVTLVTTGGKSVCSFSCRVRVSGGLGGSTESGNVVLKRGGTGIQTIPYQATLDEGDIMDLNIASVYVHAASSATNIFLIELATSSDGTLNDEYIYAMEVKK